MIEGLQDIAKDQLQNLDSCSLGALAASLTITCTNDNTNEMEENLKIF